MSLAAILSSEDLAEPVLPSVTWRPRTRRTFQWGAQPRVGVVEVRVGSARRWGDPHESFPEVSRAENARAIQNGV